MGNEIFVFLILIYWRGVYPVNSVISISSAFPINCFDQLKEKDEANQKQCFFRSLHYSTENGQTAGQKLQRSVMRSFCREWIVPTTYIVWSS